MNSSKNVFIGAAWPYCNGDLHLGHVAGLISSDVLARYFRLNGQKVMFVSGTDCHGTPITLTAEELDISPEELVNKKHPQFQFLLEKLGMSYDLYGKTFDIDHYNFVQKCFTLLYDKGLIYRKTENNPFCVQCNKFLADTYVTGTCPKCGFDKALGNQCENCGALLSPEELISLKCKKHNISCEFKNTEQFYLALSKLETEIKNWFESLDKSNWRKNSVSITKGWIKSGLKDRPITRDLDWGVPVPIENYNHKKIYVWFEAVLGYLSASQKLSKNDNNDKLWKEFWLDPSSNLIFVHGKDNVPFHTIILPAILIGLDYKFNLPTQIMASEYLLLEGQKFSKSRKWAIWLKDFLVDFDPDLLRFYLLINGPETSDSSFSWIQFQSQINDVLLGKFTNLHYRISSFLSKNWGNSIKPGQIVNSELISKIQSSKVYIGELIENGQHRLALETIRGLSIEVNVWLDCQAPWKVIKTDKQSAYDILYTGLICVAELGLTLRPFIPSISENALKSLQIDPKLYWLSSLPSNQEFNLDLKGYLVAKISDDMIEQQNNKLKNPE
jgi:methionyl-tRNA synthetase